MSTTTDLRVAVEYAQSNHSLLFKIVSPSFMTTGADIQWLSAFPSEAEILYPPLTYLKPTGRTEDLTLQCGMQQTAGEDPGSESQLSTFTIVEVVPQMS